jgi:type I restriction enzyme, R subunit
VVSVVIPTRGRPAMVMCAVDSVRRQALRAAEIVVAEKLVLDWRNKPAARADVESFISDALDELPEVYDRRLYSEKCKLAFQHVFESYAGSD